MQRDQTQRFRKVDDVGHKPRVETKSWLQGEEPIRAKQIVLSVSQARVEDVVFDTGKLLAPCSLATGQG